MSTDVVLPLDDEDIVYPDSDGAPLGEDTRHIKWIVTLFSHLEELFLDDPDVAVHGDQFWYPVRGNPSIRTAPDTMVIFGRPKSPRSSYLQWREEGVAPQFVMEVESPGNTAEEMADRLDFFDRHGVEEYYVYDFARRRLYGYLRNRHGALAPVPEMDGWVSPRVGIRFEMTDDGLQVRRPDGSLCDFPAFAIRERGKLKDANKRLESERNRFRRRAEKSEANAKAEKQRAEAEARRADEETRRADEEARKNQAEAARAEKEKANAAESAKFAEEQSRRFAAERERAERLTALLRELGVDPDQAGSGTPSNLGQSG